MKVMMDGLIRVHVRAWVLFYFSVVVPVVVILHIFGEAMGNMVRVSETACP
jgi:hypothetical protein